MTERTINDDWLADIEESGIADENEVRALCAEVRAARAARSPREEPVHFIREATESAVCGPLPGPYHASLSLDFVTCLRCRAVASPSSPHVCCGECRGEDHEAIRASNSAVNPPSKE